MKDDLLRSVTDAIKRYTGVEMQQGSVQQDSDWNEESKPAPGGIADVPDTMEQAVTNLDTDWNYGPTGRLNLYLEESLHQGTEWSVFKPNSEPERLAVEELRGYLRDPQQETNFENLRTLLNPAGGSASNIHDLLLFVFRESIEQSNEDKKYYLDKTKELSDISEKLSEYLKDAAAAAVDSEAEPPWKIYLKEVLDLFRTNH